MWFYCRKFTFAVTYQQFIGDNVKLWRHAFKIMGDTEGSYGNINPDNISDSPVGNKKLEEQNYFRKILYLDNGKFG